MTSSCLNKSRDDQKSKTGPGNKPSDHQTNQYTIEEQASGAHQISIHYIYHEASVTSYVYEIRPKIQGPFDGCQRVLTKRENPGDDVANMYHGGPVSTNEHRRFALISREILFARDVKSGLLRFYNCRPFRNFKGMVVFSRSIHHGT